MKSKIYRNYKSIERTLDRNNFLRSNLKILNGLSEVIPIDVFGINKQDKKHLKLSFSTYDRSTGQVPPPAYHSLIQYLNNKQKSGNGSVVRHQYHNNGDYFDYVQGALIMPIHMIKKSFILNKIHFSILTFYASDSLVIRMLVSRNANKDWINQLALKQVPLSYHNLEDIFYLIHLSLVNQINEIQFINSGLNINSYDIINSFKKRPYELLIQTQLSSFRVRLKHAHAYLSQYINKEPALEVDTSDFQIMLFFKPSVKNNIFKEITI